MKRIDPLVNVTIQGGDYRYEGWIVSTFSKRSGETRIVVEDSNGRLFIHNPRQVVNTNSRQGE